MKIIVQKYGGTSVATQEQRSRVVYHVSRALKEGYHVVVVVSAMGRKGAPYATDTLLGLIDEKRIKPREKDLLLSCGEVISSCVLSDLLAREGIENCVLTGGQAGIITDHRFSNAHISEVQPFRIQSELEKEKVVIVAGFQGRTMDGEITTIGRGGSDTTATTLAAALSASYVDIFTDVNGIMTADPRIVESAVPLEKVTYTEMCNLAFQGAKVMHPVAVEVAMRAGIPIRVRATMSDDVGTVVSDMNASSRENNRTFVTGITQLPCVTQIKIPVKDEYVDMHFTVFKAMANSGISVDFISINPSGIAYTVSDEHAAKTKEILEELDLFPEITPNCAKISAVGAGMTGAPGVMGTILEALLDHDISVLQSADSHTTIWVLVHGSNMEKAVKALHEKFQLDGQ